MKKKNIYVSTVVLLDWQDRALISQRSKDKILPNYWEFPGGKIKNNETPKDALIREVKEELSLEINKKLLSPLNFNTYLYEEFHATIFCYLCRSWNGSLVSKDNQKILWVKIEKLKNYNLLPGSKEFVEQLINFRKKK